MGTPEYYIDIIELDEPGSIVCPKCFTQHFDGSYLVVLYQDGYPMVLSRAVTCCKTTNVLMVVVQTWEEASLMYDEAKDCLVNGKTLETNSFWPAEDLDSGLHQSLVDYFESKDNKS